TRGLAKPVARWSKASIGAISMGQEIGVTPIQTASMVSTIANDGVWNAPRIVAGVTPPDSGPQTIAFHPANQRRVISSLTAAEMRKLMEGVVLFGTGRKAILDGYTSAGKTGTAQKVDPRTGRYSATKYVGSFVGFAPVNQPAITVAVIIDSPAGLHQGGQVAAPVFQRVTQQVLEYLHVRHDAELKKQLILRAAAKDADLEESSPDHLGAVLPITEAGDGQRQEDAVAPPVPAVLRQSAVVAPLQVPEPQSQASDLAPPTQPGLTSAPGIVLDVDATLVPSFIGKSLRGAIETAQASGIVLDAHGWGIAQEQLPPPGSRIPRGGRVAVRFAR
ncbi:MAG: penicillin-binding transpeptidase domain-containing protein, partial [Terriglobales bacterium]